MIQRVVVFLLVALVAYACASSKKVADVSIGNWDYVIKNTPEGDLSGTMVISKDGDTYTGYLEASQGRIDLSDVVVENGNLNSNFDYMGYQVLLSGIFEGNAFAGKVSVDYNDFMMTATKKE
jgi:hypothetical protein